MVGVPLSTPVTEFIESPGGTPLAAHVTVTPLVATKVPEYGVPTVPDNTAGDSVPHGFGLMVIGKLSVKLCGVCSPSRTVAVTEKVPAVVGVPTIRKYAPLSCVVDVRPGGSPVTDQKKGGPSPPCTPLPT